VTEPPQELPIETELKLEVSDPRSARRVLRSPAIDGLEAVEAEHRRDVVDRYVDTAERHLAAAGRVTRLRAADGAVLVTVKSAATPTIGAVHRREELEAPASDDLRPASWPASNARSLVLELVGDRPLEELVTIRQDRRTRRYAGEGTTVELSLDRVAIVRSGQVIGRFVELEAELVEGDDAVLARLGERLLLDRGFAPARTSKLERALAAVERRRRELERPRIAVGRTPGVEATDPLAEAGRKVMAFHLERLMSREPGTREGADPEPLHQMRVATRRLRAAWRTFDEAFDRRRTRRFRRPLRRIAAALGAVRDLDVLIDGVAAYRAGLEPEPALSLEPLLDELRGRREHARAELVTALDAPGFGRWLHAAVAFVTTVGAGGLPARSGEPRSVRELAPARIWVAYGRLIAYEPIVPWADVPTLHGLRIEGKRLRYALEFFREALGPGVDDLIARVTALQDHLGFLHDADVAGAVARDFLAAHAATLTPEQRHAIGSYVQSRDAELRRLRRAVGRPWRGVSGVLFRQRLGRVLATL